MKQNNLFRRSVALATLWFLFTLQGARGAEEPPAVDSRQPGTVTVLVAYHSLTGNTEQMAKGVVEGIKRVPGALAVLKKVEEATRQDLVAADAIVLGGPAYYGNVPGTMKAILDDWSWKLKVDFTDKVGGAFATGGGQTGGKEFVVVSLLMFMINNRMVVAGPLYRNEKTGSVWAEAGATAITGPLDPGVSENELDGARRLGERVAGLARRLKAPAVAGPTDSRERPARTAESPKSGLEKGK